jgi:hypothetical protein
METPFDAVEKRPAEILVARTPADICAKPLIDIDIDITCKPMGSPFEAAKKASPHRRYFSRPFEAAKKASKSSPHL